MLSQSSFWEDEKEANILLRNEGFLSPSGTIPSVDGWLKGAGVTDDDIKTQASQFKSHCDAFDITKADEIYTRDSNRIFQKAENREELVKILSYFQSQTGNYHQGFALSCAYVRLYLDVPSTLALFTKFNAEERYLPNVWQALAMNMAIDGYVFQELMHQHYSTVAVHLLLLGVLPETYCQKYWCALNVGVLPFECLHTFLGRFIKEGFVALFHYSLSLVKHLQTHLLACKDPGTALEFLRLDPSCKGLDRLTLAKSVVSDNTDYGLEKIDFKPLRAKAFETNLKNRTYYEEEEKKEYPKCSICKEVEAEYFCKKCDVDMCEDCMDNNPPAGHEEEEHETYTQEEKGEESDDDDAAAAMGDLSIKGTGLTPVSSPTGEGKTQF